MVHFGQSSGWGLARYLPQPHHFRNFSWWELGFEWGWWREKGVVQGTSGGDWVPLPWVQRFSHLLGFQLLTPVPAKEASSFLEGEEQACKQPLCLVRPPGTRCKNSDYYQEKQCNV